MNSLAKLLNLREEKLKKDESYNYEANIQQIILRLKKTTIKSGAEHVNVTEQQFINICRRTRSITLSQPSLLRLNSPLIVATGTVGYYKQLVQIFTRCGNVVDLFNYLFIGDYTGKGPGSIQCLLLLFCYKIKFQQNFFLLRGCHETISLARSLNLYELCNKIYSPKAWSEACEALCSLPFAALINDQVFCVHGGISPQLKAIQDINKIPRPLDTPEVGIPCDLIWSDPSFKKDSLQWTKNERGFGYTFSESAVEKFVKNKRLSLICRGHEIAYNGFEINENKTCATLTSLANYCQLFNNSAAVMIYDAVGLLYFKIIHERNYFPMEANIKMSASQYLSHVMHKKKQDRKTQKRIMELQLKEQKQLEEQKQRWRKEHEEELEFQLQKLNSQTKIQQQKSQKQKVQKKEKQPDQVSIELDKQQSDHEEEIIENQENRSEMSSMGSFEQKKNNYGKPLQFHQDQPSENQDDQDVL